MKVIRLCALSAEAIRRCTRLRFPSDSSRRATCEHFRDTDNHPKQIIRKVIRKIDHPKRAALEGDR